MRSDEAQDTFVRYYRTIAIIEPLEIFMLIPSVLIRIVPIRWVLVRSAIAGFLVFSTILSVGNRVVAAEVDSSRYMAPSEIKPGMKGTGRTVMSGTKIETFNFEVISVVSNAFYAKQDVILVRCSGLNLEHSGIIAGMSGSPCYIVDEQGHERMIGAVAYGWAFNKDPICGVQPITQMLQVAEVRNPERRKKPIRGGQSAQAGMQAD
ncbi:MAG: hypothetical protein FWC56_02215, partial [Phycisphaerae bacterium]|nr:hypothetical protein [Phycisphaerae bacterium]